MDDIKSTLNKLSEQQAQLANDLDKLKKKPKDFWDKFAMISSFLSGFIAVSIGAILTFLYHQKDVYVRQDQNRIAEMEATRKFIEPLTSNDENAKAFAILAMQKLANRELALYWVKNLPSEGTKRAGGIIMASTRKDEVKPETAQQIVADTQTSTTRGWVYLGEFSEGSWKKPYFNIKNQKPVDLVNSNLVSTGTVNIRSGMVTDDGEFQPVVSALKTGKTVRVEEIRDWLGTGYIWARITPG